MRHDIIFINFRHAALGPDTGRLMLQGETPAAGGPSVLAISPDRRVLDVGYRGEPRISSFWIDPQSGGLTLQGAVAPSRAPIASPTRHSPMSATATRKAGASAAKLLWFLNTSLKQAPQMSRLLPGRTPPEIAAQNYRTQPGPGAAAGRRPADSLIGIDAEQAIAGGILCAGNPDTVYRQIMDIYDNVGGFGHFIFVGRPGFLDHQEAEKGIRLMAKEVVPRLPAATATPPLAREAAN